MQTQDIIRVVTLIARHIMTGNLDFARLDVIDAAMNAGLLSVDQRNELYNKLKAEDDATHDAIMDSIINQANKSGEYIRLPDGIDYDGDTGRFYNGASK